MPTIHPSSVLSPEAVLAEDVIVGPRCTIEGAVTLGPGTRLIGDVYLQGPLTVGTRNTFYPYVCVGFPPQHRRFDPATPGAGCVIGDDNVFREGFSAHRAFTEEPTRIGNRNYFMAYSHVGHDCIVGNNCTLANSALLAGHVLVGDSVTFSGNGGAHQFTRIGRLAMAGGTVAVIQDLPPFCAAHETRAVSALNLVGLRRAGYRKHIEPLKEAFDIFFLGGHSNPRAVELIEAACGDDPLCAEFAEFIRTTKRGITPYGGHRSGHQGGEG